MKASPKLSASRWRLYVLAALSATLFSLLCWNIGMRWGELLDNAAYDAGFSFRPALSAQMVANKLPRSKNIVIVDLPHDIPRPLLAQLITQLRMAKVVALDLMLVDRASRLSPEEVPYFEEIGELDRWKSEDEQLTRAINKAGNVVVGSWPEVAPNGMTIGWANSASSFERSARDTAHLKVIPDEQDGLVRHVRLWETDHSSSRPPLPALSLQVAARALGQTPEQVVPSTSQLELPIDYLGSRKIFETNMVSHRMVFSYAMFCEPEDFKDDLVFVGQTDFRSKDTIITPLGEMPGVYVHANATATLLNSRGLPQHLSYGLVVLLALGSALLLVVPLTRFSFLGCALVTVIEIGGLWLFVAVLWATWRIIAPVSVPALAVLLTYNVVALYEYARARRTLGNVVGKTMLKRLLESPVDPSLGGKEEVATAFFCDLRGFSVWSQTRTPQQLIADLNAYTTTIVAIVESLGGRPIDFFGDGVFVLFEGKGHARRGVEAAIAISQALDLELRPHLRAGIALHTGSMVIGLVGHKHHYKPGAVGETINIASRVQSLSDECGFALLMTRETLEAWRRDEPSDKSSHIAQPTSCGTRFIKGYETPLEVFGLEPIA